MKFRRILFRFLFLILIILFLGYLLFPIYWAINTSLTPSKNLSKTPADYLPFPPDFNAFQRILSNSIFKISLLNSAIVAGSATLLALFLGALAACALGRFRFPGKRPILYIILAMTMFPQISIVGSLYEMIVNVGLYNTKFALAASYLLTTLPFTIWILTSFFKSLPSELEEAAYVDGATPLQTFRFVLLPLAAPGIVTSGILAFIHSWNEYLFAMTFTLNEKSKTVPVAIAQFSGQTHFEIPWGQIMAGSLVSTVPLIILVLLFQRRVISGMTAGAVKG